MWTYSRVDTVRPSALELFKKAGVDWLALGIEAGSQTVRKEVSKGTFQEVNIREVCGTVRSAGIHVISNYIFGFPDDTLQTMQQTLDLALELNTEMANMYPCQALPGSPIHRRALKEGWKLPDSYAGYAFLSYDCEPLATKHVSAADVLRFRDQAWQTYFRNPTYLDLVQRSVRRAAAPQCREHGRGAAEASPAGRLNGRAGLPTAPVQAGVTASWRQGAASYARRRPSRRSMVGRQPSERMRVLSSSLRGMPSGLLASNTSRPLKPTVSTTACASSRMLRSEPLPMLIGTPA